MVKYTGRVMSCISTASFTILINGSTSQIFHYERGLLQGCSLSPFLFLMVVDGISRFLINAKQMGGFKGLQISQVLYISHLIFVDDILFFCDGSRRDLDKLEQGINLVNICTRMAINEGKSSIVTSKIDI